MLKKLKYEWNQKFTTDVYRNCFKWHSSGHLYSTKVLSRMFGYSCVNSSVFVVHMLSVFLHFCYFSRFRKVQLTFWISSSWLFCAVNMLFRLMGTIIQYEYECKTFIQWIWVESRKDVVPETSSTSVVPVFLSWNLCAPITWTYSELLFNEMLRHSTKLNVYCFQ